jgi:hypothetical protein
LRELGYQLAILFGTNIIVKNVAELAIPFLKTLILNKLQERKTKLSRKALDEMESSPEKQINLAEYGSALRDFEELAIQFGFICLFATAFPLAPLFALLNNLVEIRIDATKVCRLLRRPEPRGVASIGLRL